MTRYDPDCEYIGAGDYVTYMMSCPNGDFVKYDDYAALKAERDALDKKLSKIEFLTEEADKNGGDPYLHESILEALRGEL